MPAADPQTWFGVAVGALIIVAFGMPGVLEAVGLWTKTKFELDMSAYGAFSMSDANRPNSSLPADASPDAPSGPQGDPQPSEGRDPFPALPSSQGGPPAPTPHPRAAVVAEELAAAIQGVPSGAGAFPGGAIFAGLSAAAMNVLRSLSHEDLVAIVSAILERAGVE